MKSDSAHPSSLLAAAVHESVRVLIVDDEKAIHRACMRALAGPERKWCSAFTAAEAEEQLALHDDIGVCIVDKNLPDGCGIDVIRRLLEIRPSLEAIMLTGYASMDSAIAAFRAGAINFVKKPFDHNDLNAKLLEAVERALANRERQRRMHHAQKLETVGMVAANVGHEVNNPLVAVLANLETLSASLRDVSPGGLSAGQLQVLRVASVDALSGVRRIQAIADALRGLCVSHEQKLTAVDLNEAVRSALKLAAVQLRAQAELVINLRTIPHATANEQQLCQVLVNVLVNAAQAVAATGRSAQRVEVLTREEGERLLIEVRDTGVGIRPDHAERIFEPFFSTKGTGKNTGLGLSLSRRMMREMGGEVIVDSVWGEGTSVTLRLPRAAAQPVAAKPTQQANLAPPPPASARRRSAHPAPQSPRHTKQATARARALLVDDDRTVLRVLKRLLKAHEVVAVSSAKAALELLENDRAFDVIMSDLTMPGMNGLELHDAVRERMPEMADRFVFMTGGTLTFCAKEAKERNVAMLDKPFDADRVRAIASESALRHRQCA